MNTKTVVTTALLTLVSLTALAQGADPKDPTGTRNDPSLMPWSDPDDPHVIRLRKDDDTLELWRDRNEKPNVKREEGPIDVQRYGWGLDYTGFPTFFKAPIAMTTEDLIAGDVDVAIVGSTTDGNLIKGTNIAANVLRGFWNSSATTWAAHGGGKMQREKAGPMEQYLRTHIQELNIVDYGNIANHLLSLDKSNEELRTVIREILDGDAVPLMVGGSHDNMYGFFLAIADKYGKGNFGVIHFDSHWDALDFGWGFYTHNGNGLYWGMEKGLFKGTDLVQVGMTGGAPDDKGLNYMRDKGVRWHYQAEIERDGWEAVMKRFLEDVKHIENLVITVDIDLISSAYAPGSAGREADGPNWPELNRALRALTIQNNVVAIEISEYNPLLDNKSAWQTAMGVNYAMRHALAGMAARKKGITDPFYYHPDLFKDGRK